MMRRVFIFFLVVALAGGCLELLARSVLFPEYRAMLPDMYGRHPVLGHYNKPNLSVRRYNPMNYDVVNRTNAFGMRGLERDRLEELSGVWVAGGSNTFGGYIADEETFVALLKKYGIQAANLGSEGHTIGSQASLIRILADEGHRPRAVILVLSMFYAILDYSADLEALNRPLSGKRFAAVNGGDPTQPTARDNLYAALLSFRESVRLDFQSIRARLLKSSAIYGWIKVGIMEIDALRDWTLRVGLRNDLDFVENFDRNLLRPLTAANPATERIIGTAEFVGAIEQMVRKELKVPFGAVLLPSHHQLHPESFKRYLNRYGLNGQDLDPLRSLEKLGAELRKRDIAVLDTFPVLANSSLSRFTFPDDGHLTAPAHALIAAAMAGWIKSEVMPDASGGNRPD